MKKFAAVLFLLAAFAAVPARADQPPCTGDRHYDETGQCCPVVTTSTTLPPTSCESSEDCDENQTCVDGVCVQVCPDPAPCPPVTVTCVIDVCVNGACNNGSAGNDGNGACTKDTDCQIVTTVDVHNTTTNNVFNVTVNRCPAQEPTVRCTRNAAGRIVCPAKHHPYQEFFPYSQAVKLQRPGAKRKIFHLPPTQ